MPVVAVVGGIAAAAGAAGGAAALIGGTITLSTVAAGITFVGGVATALGAVTGNKKLMKIGAVAGIAGFAGGLAASSFGAAASSGAGAASEGLGLKAISSLDGLQAPAAAAAEGFQLAQPATASQGFASSLGSSLSSLDTGVSALAGAESAASALPSSFALAEGGTGLLSTASAPTSAAVTPSVAGPGISMPSIGQLAPGATQQSSTSVFQNFGKFIKDNPETMKVGMETLGGLTKGYAEQQKAKQAEAAAETARKRLNDSILAIRRGA